MIRIRLTPELSGWADGKPYNVRFARVSTEVVVRSGQTFQIGGQTESQDFYEHFLVGMSAGELTGNLQVFLTPWIVE